MKELDKLRPILFKVSLAISLGLTWALFNFTSPVVLELDWEDPIEEYDTVTIERTVHKKPEMEIPKKKDVQRADPFLQKIETTEDSAPDTMALEIADTTDVTEPENVVFVRPVPKPPAPPEEPSDEPLIFAERMPVFGECDSSDGNDRKVCSDRAVMTYITENLKYPTIAKEIGVTGTVVVRFVVDKDGSVRDWEVVRDIGSGCGDAVLKVLSEMPDWKPGKQRGRPVSVYYTLPVRFNLQ